MTAAMPRLTARATRAVWKLNMPWNGPTSQQPRPWISETTVLVVFAINDLNSNATQAAPSPKVQPNGATAARAEFEVKSERTGARDIATSEGEQILESHGVLPGPLQANLTQMPFDADPTPRPSLAQQRPSDESVEALRNRQTAAKRTTSTTS
jgi:hypothetical protein